MNMIIQRKAKNDLKKDFFKIMKNFVSRKIMINVRNTETSNLLQLTKKRTVYCPNLTTIQQNASWEISWQWKWAKSVSK